MTPDRHPVDGEVVTTCYRHPGRETLVSCSRCERPICTSCMVAAPVGIRCPDCARGGPERDQSPLRRRRAPRRPVAMPRLPAGGTTVTTVLIALNVLVFLAEFAQGASFGSGGGAGLIGDGGVRAQEVADGEWWRLLTAGFVHAGLLHLLFNMWALWILGAPLEQAIGSARMGLVYLSSILWGSAGALLLSPDSLTVGASGGVFGLMGVLLVLSRHRGMEMLASGIAGLLLVNLLITVAIPGISIGGHLGGLAGGAAAGFVLWSFGRGHMAYGRITPAVAGGMVGLLAGAVVAGLLIAGAAG